MRAPGARCARNRSVSANGARWFRANVASRPVVGEHAREAEDTAGVVHQEVETRLALEERGRTFAYLPR
jgi:hypothetical protein